jgi:toxin ParE1/3/4
MTQVVIASSADADYAEIITDLAAKAGWRTAANYDELFERLYNRLADHPGSGAPRPALGRDIRIGIVTPYIVIYRDDDDSNTVTVLPSCMAAAGSPAGCSVQHEEGQPRFHGEPHFLDGGGSNDTAKAQP